MRLGRSLRITAALLRGAARPVHHRVARTVWLWAAIAILAWLAQNVHAPITKPIRGFDLELVILASAVILLRLRRTEWVAMAALLLVSATAIGEEVAFRNDVERVMGAPADQLQRLGRHVMVGYRDPSEAAQLIDRGGIGGLYVGRKNVAHRSFAEVQREVRALRAKADVRGAILLVAADQEGGSVSWLSPPLTAFPPLSRYVRSGTDPVVSIDRAGIEAQGLRQGLELAALGIDVDFSPVVDLRPTVNAAIDLHSRIQERAISPDPSVVAEVAGLYASALASSGTIPTLKHFPGLGRIHADTHLFGAEVHQSIVELEQSDWKPFRAVARANDAFMMIGHVRLSTVDGENIASASTAVIEGILRKRWAHDGVLVTDDLCMGPPYYAAGGIGASAVRALNAGIDLLLVSYDPDQYFRVMSALIDAENQGRLDFAASAKSNARLSRLAEVHANARRRLEVTGTEGSR